jgi:2,3-bisphosphoglycerate-independent phosphoglycerate mutase
MKKALLILVLAILLLPACCNAEKSAVLVIVDGLGSSYIYPDRSPACIDGSLLSSVYLAVAECASARYELWVPAPDTESGNAVIATGYSGATDEMLSYYCATIYDVLRDNGYLTIAIMETGDTSYMVAKPDIIVHERNNSLYNPCATIVVNGQSLPPGLQDLLAAVAPPRQSTGVKPADAYRQYDDWSLERAIATVRFMETVYPGRQYLLVLNVAGTDMAAHERGFNSYRQAIEDLNPGLLSLSDACREAGAVMMVTADHGMSFKSPGAKGSHASVEASAQNESRLAPLLVFMEGVMDKSGTCGQECLAPTLLALMECPDTLSIEDGEPLPVSDSPSLYLVSDMPVEVTIDGPGLSRTTTVDGTCRFGPLSSGRYTVSSPSGTRTVTLDRDRTVKISGREAAVGWTWGWLPFAWIAILSLAGLFIALYLLKRR